MIEQVANNIYRIKVTLPRNPLKALNSYLIRGEDRCVLVDTGFRIPECREALLAGLEELGVSCREIDYFITHLHSDHSGLATELVGEGHVIYMSKVDLEWLQESSLHSEARAASIAKLLKSGVPDRVLKTIYGNTGEKGSLYTIDVTHPAYIKVEEGFELAVGEYRFRCISTPGHTPGHICLWEPEHKIMLTGDHVLFDITPNITQWFGVKDSLRSYMTSLEKIRDYPVKCVLPGHREPGDYKARIDSLLYHHRQRLDEVIDILRDNPGMNAYEIAGKMTWSIRAANWDTFPDTQKYFAVGECLSHLDYLTEEGTAVRYEDEDCYRYKLN